ncbi:MAG: IMP dehydrogenase [Patescibacteria group bacterium]
MKNIPLALTYDDVLIVPRRSSLKSRSEADTKTKLTKKIILNSPLVSSNMDTVTESEMAIAMARMGGIGILHRFMTIEQNVEEIKKVKRAQNFIIENPYTINENSTIDEAKEFTEQIHITGLIVVDEENHLKGILSRRDFLFANGNNHIVKEIMTPREKLIVGNINTSFIEAKDIFAKYKIEKLPIVDNEDKVIGLITSDDLKYKIEYPNASVDKNGRLLVGASVGVHGDYLERAEELVKAGADVIVIDIAHGHSDIMFEAIKNLREKLGNEVQLIAGNIATANAAKEMCEAGIDGLKVGIGPGSICITRLVTGCGVPQLTAIMETSKIAKEYGVPIIADGGIHRSGDLVKAIGAGADTIMLGSMFSGTLESPGVIMTKGDKKFKICRGSASFTVANDRKKIKQEKKKNSDIVPEGVESIVPFKGSVIDIINQMIGGLKSGMSYTNSHTIEELKENVDFIRITNAGMTESGSHDVQAIT